jgi:AcrR family transcriptional regulator
VLCNDVNVPKVADPAVRTALLEAAARVIAEDGPKGLTLRRLATEVGTSTMAVYTHFGSMTEVRREVRREGFARLGTNLTAVERTGDPVADYFVLGWAYYRTGTEEPNLYRAMFLDGPVDAEDAGMGLETFQQCIDNAQRCLDGGRFTSGDALGIATQLWALLHGVVSLQLAHLLDPDAAITCLADGAHQLFRSYGDDPRALGRSFARGRERVLALLAAS